MTTTERLQEVVELLVLHTCLRMNISPLIGLVTVGVSTTPWWLAISPGLIYKSTQARSKNGENKGKSGTFTDRSTYRCSHHIRNCNQNNRSHHILHTLDYCNHNCHNFHSLDSSSCRNPGSNFDWDLCWKRILIPTTITKQVAALTWTSSQGCFKCAVACVVLSKHQESYTAFMYCCPVVQKRELQLLQRFHPPPLPRALDEYPPRPPQYCCCWYCSFDTATFISHWKHKSVWSNSVGILYHWQEIRSV